MVRFDDSFRSHCPRRLWANFGKPWSTEEIKALDHLFGEGNSLKEICGKLERPAAGVMSKLAGTLGLMSYDGKNGYELTIKGEQKLLGLDRRTKKSSANLPPPKVLSADEAYEVAQSIGRIHRPGTLQYVYGNWEEIVPMRPPQPMPPGPLTRISPAPNAFGRSMWVNPIYGGSDE